MSLILASTSPRRKELLSLITTDFEVVASDFDESALTAADPRQTAENLAFGKCIRPHRGVRVARGGQPQFHRHHPGAVFPPFR